MGLLIRRPGFHPQMSNLEQVTSLLRAQLSQLQSKGVVLVDCTISSMFNYLNRQTYGALSGKWYLCSSLSPTFPPGREKYTSLPHYLFDGRLVGDLHWLMSVGRRSNVPALSRNFEKHCTCQPILLCSCTWLREYTPVVPAPLGWAQQEETLRAGPKPMHSQKLSPAKSSRATAIL